MKQSEQQKAAKEFAEFWKGKGYEKGQSQTFWLSLLSNIFGIQRPEALITFEDQVMLDHTSFIDGYIEQTHVLIEQKSIDKDLNAPIKQSDGTSLTPFQQAKRYSAELGYSKRPRWVITCNFKEFHIYDMETPQGDPEILLLENFPKEYHRLNFLVDENDTHIAKELEISKDAGKLVAALYDELLKQYNDPTNEHSLKSLNMLCVRLVFCCYAEDAGLFGEHNKFGNYLKTFNPDNVRAGLIELFKTLNTKPEDRDPYGNEILASFPYVNGGLFAEEKIEIPRFNDTILKLLINDASENFDWSKISPTIFGAIFESTLNPETRRSGGMHYTSIENIHKVIDPLFLDDLKKELEEIKQIQQEKTRSQKLLAYQDKLASLKFLDPACGSGNFLTETYLSLRRLENEAIAARMKGQMLVIDEPVKVSIGQFYGIEINDFAVAVAKTALWIAEAQMLQETEVIAKTDIDFLPLKDFENIVEANALRIDWNDVVPKNELSYIMGNPPFIGYSLQTEEQKKEMRSIYVDENGKEYKMAGKIDYVAGWYFKAAEFMYGTNIRAAFVATNSITQGDQVASVWKPLYERFGISIDFAYRTFIWNSEANDKAHVYCVIVGFSSNRSISAKIIFNGENKTVANNISPYLIDAENIFIESSNKPVCDCLPMLTGNRPADGGNLIIESRDYEDFIQREPKAIKFIKRFTGSDEFINNKKRYCLWLVGANPSELRTMPYVMERVEACRKDRLASPDKGRRGLANTPTLFRETNNPDNILIFPQVSSEKRFYVPIGFDNSSLIVSNLLFIIPDADIYYFGILTSFVHMAWMRAVCGRLEMRYRYSAKIVYNNFPWPEAAEEQKAEIEKTAQGILDARALYPDSSLADLYDELTMPPELRKAHNANDKAVLKAYGLKPDTSEEEIVAFLMKRYQELTKHGG